MNENNTIPTQSKADSERKWAMAIHLSVLAGLLVPLAGLVIPIVLWQVKKADIPSLDPHGKMVTNFIISLVIYTFIAIILSMAFIGIFVLVALAVVGIVFPIIGGVKAGDGELWNYPLTIKFLK